MNPFNNTILCPFAEWWEFNCPYNEEDICNGIDINVGNGDSWCGSMVELGAAVKKLVKEN